MARNPFFNPEPDTAVRPRVERAINVLRSFLATRTVAELRVKLVRAGFSQALADTVVQLEEIPDPVIAALLARIPDVPVRQEVRRRLNL